MELARRQTTADGAGAGAWQVDDTALAPDFEFDDESGGADTQGWDFAAAKDGVLRAKVRGEGAYVVAGGRHGGTRGSGADRAVCTRWCASRTSM